MNYQSTPPVNEGPFVRSATALSLLLLLAACGGGSVNSASSGTPPNNPAPTPTPTPAPTNASLPASVSETFTTASAKTIGTVENGTGLAQDVAPSRASYGTLSVAYDANADSYTLADEAASRTFLPSDKGTGDGSFDYYVQSSGTTTNELELFKSGSANSNLQLTYVTYALWSTATQGVSTTRLSNRFTVFGVPTPVANLPKTGKATFSGVADGSATLDGQAYRLAGSTGTVEADFATGIVRTTIALVGNPDPLSNAAGTVTLGTLHGTGAVGSASSRYTGTISGLPSQISGSFGGGFFGPAASETGLTFSATKEGSTDSAVGVLVGKR